MYRKLLRPCEATKILNSLLYDPSLAWKLNSADERKIPLYFFPEFLTKEKDSLSAFRSSTKEAVI